MFSKLRIIPRWAIFSIDLFICATAFLLAYLLSHNFALEKFSAIDIIDNLLITLAVNSLVFFALKTYAGIIRYTGQQDSLRILSAVLITGLLLNLIGYVNWGFINTAYSATLLQIIIYSLLSLFGLIFYRILIKSTFSHFRNYHLQAKQVIIYGAGEAGLATLRVLQHDGGSKTHIVAFIDDNPQKIDKIVDGIKIHPTKNLKSLWKKYLADELIIAAFNLPIAKRNAIVELCLELGIKVFSIPPVQQWINGEFSTGQLQAIKIENLLEREPIKINNAQINSQISQKRILVTGAAGSIGSEIVRQLLNFNPESIIICDHAESPLHELELELRNLNSQTQCITFLGSVVNKARMEELFTLYRPQYVYHAAAYKHVPMMEHNPSEAILTNVMGTRIMADLSIKFKADRFVMVSTDKAVNPTNVMGASKRLAEIYIQSLSYSKTATKFITTRFGNVLGSNGSVINLFRDQIEKGGPITVTHPEITRFFMTIPEACQLVLEAGSMGKGGEIFVFDMGEPVPIVDLARKMIRLYGLSPDLDIKIEYTGLRPGEKLYEELLANTENTLPTYHDKIMIARVREPGPTNLNTELERLFSLAEKQAGMMMLVSQMKALVPEFVSNNSVFEELDEIQEQKVIPINRVS